MESVEIDIAPIHHVEGTRFGDQQIEDVDIVKSAFADMYERRDVSPQIQQDMQLGRELGVTGTPTFFINGKKYVGYLSPDDLRAALR